MISDAHVHMGYFSALRTSALKYYTPQRVVGVLNRCRVDAFIVSSTSAQASVSIHDLLNEAMELKRLAGHRARIFCWVSPVVLMSDPSLHILDSGCYDGIKLHEHDGHWIQSRQHELRRILDMAAERALPVQFHCDESPCCDPWKLHHWAGLYPSIRFDFAHCCDMQSMSAVIGRNQNVWTDTAYMSEECMAMLPSYNWHDRLMFGSDLPVWQAYEDVSLTKRYREMVRCFLRTGLAKSADIAFNKFLGLI